MSGDAFSYPEANGMVGNGYCGRSRARIRRYRRVATDEILKIRLPPNSSRSLALTRELAHPRASPRPHVGHWDGPNH
jgi:hypothetical protein